MDLGQGLLGLGLGFAETLAQKLFVACEGLDVGIGIFVQSLEFGDAGAFLLAELEGLGVLGLELILLPIVVLPSELDFLLQGLLAVLGRVCGCLRSLDGLIERCDLLVQLQNLLVLLLEFVGEVGIGLGLGVDNGECLSVGCLQGGDACPERLDLGSRRGAGGFQDLELILKGSSGRFCERSKLGRVIPTRPGRGM